MKFNIEQAIEQSTVDGKLDANKLMEFVDKDYVNTIVAKNKPDLDKITLEAKEEWINSLGFEGVANESQLKAYVKKSADETKEDYAILKTEYDSFKETVKDYGDLKKANTTNTREKVFNKDNFNGDVDYALYKINQSVNDDKDFETAYAEYKESNPKSFAPNKVPNAMASKVTTTDGVKKYGFEEILEEQGKL